jgi:hypothetical protein
MDSDPRGVAVTPRLASARFSPGFRVYFFRPLAIAVLLAVPSGLHMVRGTSASDSALVVKTLDLPASHVHLAYSASLAASGGNGPYAWKWMAGRLPLGLRFAPESGAIFGIPREAGTFSFSVEVSDSSTPPNTARANERMVIDKTSSDCPTGQPCGADAPYCQSYTPPATQGAKLINKLPYKITSPGNYYLDSDLATPATGIAILTTNGKVDINLNGHTITYGTAGSHEQTAVGDYGLLICNTGNLGSEDLDPSFGSNGFCANGGLSSNNVTIENGSIVQSPEASGYAVPNSVCPGAGVSCARDFPKTFSHAIASFYNGNLSVKHVTLTWQAVGSDGIKHGWIYGGDDIECSTFYNKVSTIDARSAMEGTAIWFGNTGHALSGAKILYNTIIGGPQTGILMEVPRSIVEYNDLNLGFFQQKQMYSNDYALGAGTAGGLIAYNYIHNTVGRGIGAGDADTSGLAIHDNFIATTEQAVNSEYGTGGAFNGCEIDGTYGIRLRSTSGVAIYRNAIHVTADECGAQGIKFTGVSCLALPSCKDGKSFDVHENRILATRAPSAQFKQPLRCYSFDEFYGSSGNYLQIPITDDDCTTDGDFAGSDWDMASGVFFERAKFALGAHPLPMPNGQQLVEWGGGATSPTGPPDETQWVFTDMAYKNGATEKESYPNSKLAHQAVIQWTYDLTLETSDGKPLDGALVTAVDARNTTTSGLTDSNGNVRLRLIDHEYGNASNEPAQQIPHNPNLVTIVKKGCVTLRYNLNITATERQSRDLHCGP